MYDGMYATKERISSSDVRELVNSDDSILIVDPGWDDYCLQELKLNRPVPLCPEARRARILKVATTAFDGYRGVIVNVKKDMDENVFITLLRTSLSQWRQQGKKGVWLKLTIELVNLVKPEVHFLGAMRAFEQKTRDLDVEFKQLKAFKAFTA
ncbi:NUDIX hydrolase 2-like protein [Tanacetum coccineum]